MSEDEGYYCGVCEAVFNSYNYRREHEYSAHGIKYDTHLCSGSPAGGRKDDAVSYPAHYTRFPGIEVIQLTEHLNFCRGNAVKYIARAGSKRDEGGKSIADKEIEDLEKARWYLDREITRLKGKGG